MRKTSKFSILCGMVVALGGCVKQSEYDSLQSRVQQQDRQLQQMQPAQADTWAQMQSMRQELNTVRGQLDDLQNAGGAKALVDKVNRHDAALRRIGTTLAMDLQLEAPAAPQQGAYMGETPPQQSMVVSGPATQGGFAAAPAQQAQQPAAPAVPKDTATALYESGVKSFDSRRYQEALRSFRDFTTTYSSNKLNPNAWFWVGECNFQLNQFADAALAYDTVITKYATSPKAPAAYLKQGISFSKLGQKEAARARMQELIRKFPTSAEAARAKAFLQDNK